MFRSSILVFDKLKSHQFDIDTEKLGLSIHENMLPKIGLDRQVIILIECVLLVPSSGSHDSVQWQLWGSCKAGRGWAHWVWPKNINIDASLW